MIVAMKKQSENAFVRFDPTPDCVLHGAFDSAIYFCDQEPKDDPFGVELEPVVITTLAIARRDNKRFTPE